MAETTPLSDGKGLLLQSIIVKSTFAEDEVSDDDMPYKNVGDAHIFQQQTYELSETLAVCTSSSEMKLVEVTHEEEGSSRCNGVSDAIDRYSPTHLGLPENYQELPEPEKESEPTPETSVVQAHPGEDTDEAWLIDGDSRNNFSRQSTEEKWPTWQGSENSDLARQHSEASSSNVPYVPVSVPDDVVTASPEHIAKFDTIGGMQLFPDEQVGAASSDSPTDKGSIAAAPGSTADVPMYSTAAKNSGKAIGASTTQSEWKDVCTVMMQHLPNTVTQPDLLQELDDAGFSLAYNFVHLPVGPDTFANRGYAFINFASPELALRFRNYFEGRKFRSFSSSKKVSVAPAALQGYNANCCNYFRARGSKSRYRRNDMHARPLITHPKESYVDMQSHPKNFKSKHYGLAVHQAAELNASNAGRGKNKPFEVSIAQLLQQQGHRSPTPPPPQPPLAVEPGNAHKSFVPKFCCFCGAGTGPGFKFCQFCGKSLYAQ